MLLQRRRGFVILYIAFIRRAADTFLQTLANERVKPMLAWPFPLRSGNQNNETALLQAARRGDRAAFDALSGPYRPLLRGFLARRVGTEAADDLLQDVLLASWQALPRFEGRAGFKTWLFRIALHKCLDFFRREERTPLAPSTGEADWARSPEELYAAAETRELVRQVLTTLPPPQREVVELYYYAELTLPEVASVLKRNLNTVKYQFYRAHERVAALLTEEGSSSVPAPVPASPEGMRS